MLSQKIGGWAFILGVVIAIIAGIAQAATLSSTANIELPGALFIPLVLVILGIIVGVLNIDDRDTTEFLVASIALLALAISAAGLQIIPTVGQYLVSVVNNVAVFVAPAALVVALKSVNKLANKP